MIPFDLRIFFKMGWWTNHHSQLAFDSIKILTGTESQRTPYQVSCDRALLDRYSGFLGVRGPGAPWVRPVGDFLDHLIPARHGSRSPGHLPEIFRAMSRRLQTRWHFGACCSFPWASWRNHRGYWHQRPVLEPRGEYTRVCVVGNAGDMCREKNVGKNRVSIFFWWNDEWWGIWMVLG